MRANLTQRMVAVSEHTFWHGGAEAQLLASEGNRLIGRDIAEGMRGSWRSIMRWLEVRHRRHLPPM